MIKVAITGATGFVGQALLQLLEQEPDINIILIGRNNTQNYQSFINIETESHARMVSQLENFDTIIHLAARAHNHKSTLEDFNRDNVELTKKLLKIAIDAKVSQFIYLSSVKVLGNTTAENKPFTIHDIPMPADNYGKSKWECEKLVISHLINSATAYTIIRPTLVWGKNVKGNLRALINLIDKGIPLPFGGINNRRDIVSLKNLTNLIRLTLLNPKAFNDIFLVSDGQSLPTLEIIHLLEKLTDRKAKIIYCPKFIFSIAKRIPQLKTKIESFSGNLEVDISYTLKKLDWMPVK